MGRTPVAIGKKDGAYCASFESFAYLNLGYEEYRELGPGEIVVMTPEAVVTLVKPGEKMKICTFLWVYYGYPASSYEDITVEADETSLWCGDWPVGDTKKSDADIGGGRSGFRHGTRHRICQ